MERDGSCAPPSTGEQLLAELSGRRAVPLGVHLQVADRCNHACVHCYQVQGLKGELSLAQVCELIDRLAEAGVLTLSVSGGEATLRPDLLSILRHARARGFAVRLYTNAYAVTDALADALVEIGLLEVHVSVYSDRDAEHDAVTRVPGSLARTLTGIRRLRARGVRVCMKSPALAAAAGATPRLQALAEELGCAFEPSTDITPREDGALETMALGAPTPALVAAGLLAPWLPSPDDAALRAARLAGGSCGVGSGGIVVLPNGEVLPCSDTLVPLGNLARRPLTALLEESRDAALLRGLTWADIRGCRACDLLLACSRCHATALRQGGDYLGPYESACRRARERYAVGLGRDVTFASPTADCGPARSVEVGPYRIDAPGVLRPIHDPTTDHDEERARLHPWLRSATLPVREASSDYLPTDRPQVPVERLRPRVGVRRE